VADKTVEALEDWLVAETHMTPDDASAMKFWEPVRVFDKRFEASRRALN
jgi:hypothetical protein